jgi:hypothetical protein
MQQLGRARHHLRSYKPYGVSEGMLKARKVYAAMSAQKKEMQNLKNLLKQMNFGINYGVQGSASAMAASRQRRESKPAPEPSIRKAYAEATMADGTFFKITDLWFAIMLPAHISLAIANGDLPRMAYSVVGLLVIIRWIVMTRTVYKNQQLAYFVGHLPEEPLSTHTKTSCILQRVLLFGMFTGILLLMAEGAAWIYCNA